MKEDKGAVALFPVELLANKKFLSMSTGARALYSIIKPLEAKLGGSLSVPIKEFENLPGYKGIVTQLLSELESHGFILLTEDFAFLPEDHLERLP